MTADEVESALTNLHTLHPDLITLIALPYKTWENRTCRAVRLRAGSKTDRTGVLFTGSMHAREWGRSDICIDFPRFAYQRLSLTDAACLRRARPSPRPRCDDNPQ
ncbi:MAG: hypothetical protein M0C28_05225 [Candidatus Moduliflexus flocculans]|nr:hypothetical protein [Candidatus Moduliflexus flocculans]